MNECIDTNIYNSGISLGMFIAALMGTLYILSLLSTLFLSLILTTTSEPLCISNGILFLVGIGWDGMWQAAIATHTVYTIYRVSIPLFHAYFRPFNCF